MKKKISALLICLVLILTSIVTAYAGDETYPYGTNCIKPPITSTQNISK